MARKYNPRVEEARKQGDYEELSRLGRLGGLRSGEVRRAKRDKELKRLELMEELESTRRARLLAGVHEKLRQGNEDWCPPH